MSQNKHSAPEALKAEAAVDASAGPDPMVRMVIRVPRSLKGHLRHIAFDQQYTVERLAAQALAEYAARETARNGAAA